MCCTINLTNFAEESWLNKYDPKHISIEGLHNKLLVISKLNIDNMPSKADIYRDEKLRAYIVIPEIKKENIYEYAFK
jgi:hypothetical protein